MKKKKVTLNLDSDIYIDFQKYCDKNAFIVSKKIELLLKEVLKNDESK